MTTQQAGIMLVKKDLRLFFRNAPYVNRALLQDGGAEWDVDECCWFVEAQHRLLAFRLLAEVMVEMKHSSLRNPLCGRYIKVKGSWCVQMPADYIKGPGTVTARKTSGEEKQETLGACVQENTYAIKHAKTGFFRMGAQKLIQRNYESDYTPNECDW